MCSAIVMTNCVGFVFCKCAQCLNHSCKVRRFFISIPVGPHPERGPGRASTIFDFKSNIIVHPPLAQNQSKSSHPAIVSVLLLWLLVLVILVDSRLTIQSSRRFFGWWKIKSDSTLRQTPLDRLRGEVRVALSFSFAISRDHAVIITSLPSIPNTRTIVRSLAVSFGMVHIKICSCLSPISQNL